MKEGYRDVILEMDNYKLLGLSKISVLVLLLLCMT